MQNKRGPISFGALATAQPEKIKAIGISQANLLATLAAGPESLSTLKTHPKGPSIIMVYTYRHL